MKFAIELKEPIVIRYPRGEEGKISFSIHNAIEKGKAEILKQGEDITIIAIGKMVTRAMEVARLLEQDKIAVEVVNARFLKPLDEEVIITSMKKTKQVITIEDNSIEGGLGSCVAELVSKYSLKEITMKKFGYPDQFIQHGSVEELEKEYGLAAEEIAKYCKEQKKQGEMV